MVMPASIECPLNCGSSAVLFWKVMGLSTISSISG